LLPNMESTLHEGYRAAQRSSVTSN